MLTLPTPKLQSQCFPQPTRKVLWMCSYVQNLTVVSDFPFLQRQGSICVFWSCVCFHCLSGIVIVTLNRLYHIRVPLPTGCGSSWRTSLEQFWLRWFSPYAHMPALFSYEVQAIRYRHWNQTFVETLAKILACLRWTSPSIYKGHLFQVFFASSQKNPAPINGSLIIINFQGKNSPEGPKIHCRTGSRVS